MIVKKSQLKLFIKECLKEISFRDDFESSRAMSKIHSGKLDDFTKSYIVTALFSSTDNLEPSGGSPLDQKYSIENIDGETISVMKKQCKEFQKLYKYLYEEFWTDAEAGADFWYTRNGHGTGFWDKASKGTEQGNIGELLTKVCKRYGEFNLYLGDGPHDGTIFGSPLEENVNEEISTNRLSNIPHDVTTLISVFDNEFKKLNKNVDEFIVLNKPTQTMPVWIITYKGKKQDYFLGYDDRTDKWIFFNPESPTSDLRDAFLIDKKGIQEIVNAWLENFAHR